MDTFEQELILKLAGVVPPPSARTQAPLEAPREVPRESAVPSCLLEALRQHGTFVIGLLGKLGVPGADVEDVAQEVYLAIHTELPSFEARASFKTWLCGVCRHKAADYRRKGARRKGLFRSHPPDPLPEADCPQDALLLQEAKQLLRRALARLSDEQLEVFVLHAVEDLPMRSVAALIGCPLDTAYTRYRAARKSVEAYCQRAGRSEHP
jgi:RNA polymerase sigma-70 factor (ECF subfamily)